MKVVVVVVARAGNMVALPYIRLSWSAAVAECLIIEIWQSHLWRYSFILGTEQCHYLLIKKQSTICRQQLSFMFCVATTTDDLPQSVNSYQAVSCGSSFRLCYLFYSPRAVDTTGNHLSIFI